jgi:CBS domain-containing protein
MNVLEILHTKGTHVHSISPDAMLADVVRELVSKNCGSLLVMRNDQLVGIITERDILRACAADPRPLGQIPVREKMTPRPITGSPADDVTSIMGLLTQHRIRHLPIIDDGELAGLISIGDVVKAQHDRLIMENQFLKEYIHG